VTTDVDVTTLLDHLFRRQAAQMVATLTRVIGARNLTIAEEAVQDALVTALQQWPFRGVPDNTAAWLFRVARNRALDRLRHERIISDKAPAVTDAYRTRGHEPSVEAQLSRELPSLEDDQLTMMFLTCHPVVPPEARVALTLKIVGGFSVHEIARAYVVQESAIAQRLVRAKRLLREQDVTFGQPTGVEMAERLDSVLEAIYLMFNEGYSATAGDALVREDISAEAIRLASFVVHHPATSAPRAWALLALLLFHAARFAGRTNTRGDVFRLRDQDRTTWDRRLINQALQAMDRAAAGDEISNYHLEAEIAACHALAPTWADTDWGRIVACYDRLLALTQSPIVRLNRAIALAQVQGAQAAIAEVEAIARAGVLDGYHLLPAALAELWRELGDSARAAHYYRDALACPLSAPERRFLSSRLDNL
jgi:RNA polymerase sigma-70 factor (ECF subfamily)